MLKLLNKTAIAFCLLMAAATATEHLVQVDRATDEIEDEKTVDSGLGAVCGVGSVEGPSSSCYRFQSYQGTWPGAQEYCQNQHGGRLAVLDTHIKNAFIIGNLAMLYKHERTSCWWIGAKRMNGNIKWQDQYGNGYNMTYTFWNANQPDDHNGIEDYIQICKYDVEGLQHYGWNDNKRWEGANFICESSL